MFLSVCAVINETVTLFAIPTSYYEMLSVLCIKKDSPRRKLQEQIFVDLHKVKKVKQCLRLDFKGTNM